MFGSSSPFGQFSISPFGASSVPAFGSTMPAYGASSSPAFGSLQSSFGNTTFGQTPALGGFGSTNPQQSSPFGSSFPQSQPAFSNNLYGSTSPFGVLSTPAFGATTTPAFGSTSTPAFGATTTPTFGSTSTPAFGATTTSAFGSTSTPAFDATSTPAFGSTSTPAFGATTTPAFGSTSIPTFGSTTTPAFGSISTPAFASTTTPAFGSTSTPAFGVTTTTPAFGSTPTPTFGSTCSAFGTSFFGASSTSAFGNTNTNAINTPAFGPSITSTFGSSTSPSFTFGSSPAFGQSVTTFGSSPFVSTSPFGAQTSQFGAQLAATPTFASAGFGQNNSFGGQRAGSRVAPYTETAEQSHDASNTQGKLESISAMAAYKEKCLEELRWEDYQAGDKGGPNPAGLSSFGATTNPTQSNQFATSSTFGQTAPNSFFPAVATTNNIFSAKSSPFGTTTPSPFGAQPAATPTFASSGFGQNNSFGGQRVGSRVVRYTATAEQSQDGDNTQGKVEAISAMAVYEEKCHEELRWEDYQAGDKGELNPAGQSSFGATTNPTQSNRFATSSTFGQTAPNFFFSPAVATTNNIFSAKSSPFGTTTPSPFGAQPAATPTFASSGFGQNNSFGGQRVGSRVVPYTATAEQSQDGSNTQGKVIAISAMAVYKEKCQEELRWEDFQAGDKGGRNPFSQSSFGATTNPTQSSPFATSSTFGQTAPNSFFSSALATTNNIFAAQSSPFGTTTTPSPFGQSTQTSANPFAPAQPSPFGHSTQISANPFAPAQPWPFGQSTQTSANPYAPAQPSQQPSLFGTTTSGFGSTSSAFDNTTSLFGTGSGQVSTSAFGTGFGNTGPSSLFGPTTSLGQSTSVFGQTGSSFDQTGSTFGQTNLFSTPNNGFPTMFSTTPSSQGFGQATPTLLIPFQSGFLDFGPVPPDKPSASDFDRMSPLENTLYITKCLPVVLYPSGTVPAMPQISIGRAGTSPSVQYGIASLPVVDKPAPERTSSLLTSRHISQRRINLPARKYNPKSDGQKVAFFCDEDDVPSSSTAKADAVFVPRENPRTLVIPPMEQWPSRNNTVTTQPPYENDENGHVKENTVQNPTSDGTHDDQFKSDTSSSYITLTNHRGGKAEIVYEHGTDIEALMPKLRRSDYYMEPRIEELAAKERAYPGSTRHVTDFVIGRHGYGSIKFLGHTDVRYLDIESLVQFNNREVTVYMDETKKPPVGQGLNKPAEVTLLNIKCFDKNSGTHITEEPRIEKYKELLIKTAVDQGAEFVSYDPVKGEWKFRVDHFSKYKLDDEDEYEEDI